MRTSSHRLKYRFSLWIGVALPAAFSHRFTQAEELSIPLAYQLESTPAKKSDRELLTVTVRADADGKVASAQIEANLPHRGADAIALLNKQMVQISNIARGAGQPVPDVALKIDDGLRYEFVIRAIQAVSYYKDPSGVPIPLAAKLLLRTQNFEDAVLGSPSNVPIPANLQPPITVKPGAVIVKPNN